MEDLARRRAGAPKRTYEQLYERHYRHVLAYCLRRTHRNDAGDLTAEVFTVAWRRLDQMPAGDDALPWLYAVAFRVVSQHRRQAGRRRSLLSRLRPTESLKTSGPELEVVRKLEHDLVIRASQELPLLDQEILRLTYWEELSSAQVAQAIGSTEAAVRQRLHRARKRLARRYRRLGGVHPSDPVGPGGGG